MLMEKDIGGTKVCCTEAKQLWWTSCQRELRRFGSWQRWHAMTQDPTLEHHIPRSLGRRSGTTWCVYGLRSANVMRTFHTMFVWWLHVRFSTRRQVHPTFSAAFSPLSSSHTAPCRSAPRHVRRHPTMPLRGRGSMFFTMFLSLFQEGANFWIWHLRFRLSVSFLDNGTDVACFLRYVGRQRS